MTDRVLVLVVGAGRSGTSSLAGVLSHLGFHVPPPVVSADPSNPRGHFEPQWVVDFHQRILAASGYVFADGDPLASSRVLQTARRGDYQAELHDWLDAVSASETRLVVKDPRTVWVASLWAEVAAEMGLRVCYVTMLRHPAEVVSSHSRHYTPGREGSERLRAETALLAGWINLNLVAEEATRMGQRHSIMYADLLSDWRRELAPLQECCDLQLDLNGADAARVDEFVDPELRRVRRTWDGNRIPLALRNIASALWIDLEMYARGKVEQSEYIASVDRHRVNFRNLYTASDMIVRDRTRRAAQAERRVGYKEALADAAKALNLLR
ncbi:hypothetical protein NF556_19805 [Ornithinimicrobium faecis]|uniref:Sulfotransferase family protein n=1 Tax=Ornithinimicrobium faecis TaxID=2934158 RepID=A0ABY4YTA3_9MICO|nr:hypothetical protein [Ornithinimicrobium sp. HY1793]USQ79804.1 hypothetical protein NF556_19805 [Ornithinimicrobium sp. HY1793]